MAKTKSQVYSIVDLETTGISAKDNGKIIQFSCVQIKDGKIINKYSTKINPKEKLDSSIIRLTGLTDKQLFSAPTFKEKAEKIQKLLKDTIFVAHNVNFDFPFLNTELERVKFPILKNEAIDTVALSKLIFPTLPGYRLEDLSKHFKFDHLHPHSADSDALVTAQLFLVILNYLKNLPSYLFQQIIKLNPELPAQTLLFLQDIYDNYHKKVNDNSFSSDLKLVNGLLLRKNFLNQNGNFNSVDYSQKSYLTYPWNAKDKETFFKDNVTTPIPNMRSKFSNTIYGHLSNFNNLMLLDYSFGNDIKTAYLLPLVYLNNGINKKETSRDHTLISLPSLSQQNYLQDKVFPRLQYFLPFNIYVSILQPPYYYLDLKKFKRSLFTRGKSPQTQFLKAQILIWLTQTNTGDLSEINTQRDAAYLQTIRHQGTDKVNVKDPFFNNDFWSQALKKSLQSQFIIINHNYLNKYPDFLSNEFRHPRLVIDQPQTLINNEDRGPILNVDFVKIKHILVSLDKELKLISNNLLSVSFKKLVDKLRTELNHGIKLIDKFLSKLAFYFVYSLKKKSFILSDGSRFIILNKSQLKKFFKHNWHLILQWNSSLKKTLNLLNTEILYNNEQFKTAADVLFMKNVSQLQEEFDNYNGFYRTLQLKNKNNLQYRVSFNTHDKTNKLNNSNFKINNIIGSLPTSALNLNDRIYSKFKSPLLISANMFSIDNEKPLIKKLGIEKVKYKNKRFNLSSDFVNHPLLYFVNHYPTGTLNMQSDNYASFLANSINDLFNNNSGTTIILFNSLSLMNRVVSILTNDYSDISFSLKKNKNNWKKLERHTHNSKRSLILGDQESWLTYEYQKDPTFNISSNIVLPDFSSNSIITLKQALSNLTNNYSPKISGKVTVMNPEFVKSNKYKSVLDKIGNYTPYKVGSIEGSIKS